MSKRTRQKAIGRTSTRTVSTRPPITALSSAPLSGPPRDASGQPTAPVIDPEQATTRPPEPSEASLTFPSVIGTLGAAGAFAATAIPLAMVMVERKIELGHLSPSTAWYITALLPRSYVLSQLGSILLGLSALLCAGLFALAVYIMFRVGHIYDPDKHATGWGEIRYFILLVGPPIVIVAGVSVLFGHNVPSLVAGLITGSLLGVAMMLAVIPTTHLGPLNNQVSRFVWVVSLRISKRLGAGYP